MYLQKSVYSFEDQKTMRDVDFTVLFVLVNTPKPGVHLLMLTGT